MQKAAHDLAGKGRGLRSPRNDLPRIRVCPAGIIVIGETGPLAATLDGHQFSAGFGNFDTGYDRLSAG